MSLTIGQFLTQLDGYTDRIPTNELRCRLKELEIEFDDVREFVRFSNEHYQRNLMHEGSAYHALIICWKNGQRSPIHDHRGSSCGVRILSGVATETLFERSPNGLVYPISSRQLPPGSVTGLQDNEMHQVSNLQAGDANLVTLHIYSPPLLVMGAYSLTDDSVEDFVPPIFEFAAGAGI